MLANKKIKIKKEPKDDDSYNNDTDDHICTAVATTQLCDRFLSELDEEEFVTVERVNVANMINENIEIDRKKWIIEQLNNVIDGKVAFVNIAMSHQDFNVLHKHMTDTQKISSLTITDCFSKTDNHGAFFDEYTKKMIHLNNRNVEEIKMNFYTKFLNKMVTIRSIIQMPFPDMHKVCPFVIRPISEGDIAFDTLIRTNFSEDEAMRHHSITINETTLSYDMVPRMLYHIRENPHMITTFNLYNCKFAFSCNTALQMMNFLDQVESEIYNSRNTLRQINITEKDIRSGLERMHTFHMNIYNEH
jgi:hypothetical protein